MLLRIGSRRVVDIDGSCCNREIAAAIFLNAKNGRCGALIQALIRKYDGRTRLIVIYRGDKQIDGVGVVERDVYHCLYLTVELVEGPSWYLGLLFCPTAREAARIQER